MALLNFRDVADGLDDGPLRPGRLFRSAQPYHLTDADLAVVRDAGIRTAVDLRQEHEQVPPDWTPAVTQGLSVVRLPVADQILPSEEEKAPPRRRLADPDTVPEGHRILGAFYRAIVDQAGGHLATLVATVADGAPVLLHCAAGKDRTGTTVALLLDLIGTDPEAIVGRLPAHQRGAGRRADPADRRDGRRAGRPRRHPGGHQRRPGVGRSATCCGTCRSRAARRRCSAATPTRPRWTGQWPPTDGLAHAHIRPLLDTS